LEQNDSRELLVRIMIRQNSDSICAAGGLHSLCDRRRRERLNSAATAVIIREFLPLGAILVIAVVLRLLSLGTMNFWLDEIYSVTVARMPWHSLWVVVQHDCNMSLYYALLHVWIRVGDSEAAVRLLSVVLGVATLPVVYVLGKHLFSMPVGLTASLLLAINGFHIQYCHEARGYSLVVLLTALSSLSFVKYIDDPSLKSWLLYVVTSVLAIHAHVFAVLVILSQCASLVFLRRGTPWKGIVSALASIGILSSPLGLLLLAKGANPIAWVPKPTLHTIYGVFYALAGNAEFDGAKHGGKLILLLYFLLCLVALVSGTKRLLSAANLFPVDWNLGLLVSWLFVPIIIASLISLVHPVVVNRYLIVCLVPLALLAARGSQLMTPRWLAVGCIVTVVGLTGYRSTSYYEYRSHHGEWKPAAHYVLTEARPGDAAIFFIAPGRLLFDYYRQHAQGVNGPLALIYPDFKPGDNYPSIVDYVPSVAGGFFDRVSTDYHRVWLILYADEFANVSKLSGEMQSSLSARYPNMKEERFESVRVLLYSEIK
jgi:mannosyltransferase